MRGARALFSSGRTKKREGKAAVERDLWRTPEWLLERVRQVNAIALDPCGHPQSLVRAMVSWSGPDHGGTDGLAASWREVCDRFRGLAFANVPYSAAKQWVAKCIEEAADGAEIVLLVASRTGAQWFAPCWGADAGCFVRGRMEFIRHGDGKATSAPFDSFVGYWGPRVAQFVAAFDDVGELFRKAGSCERCLARAVADAEARVRAPELAAEDEDDRPTNGVH